MTQEERKEFRKCKNIIEKIDYYSFLMDTINKNDIVDAEYYEVINDKENNSKDDEESSILQEYRKLRNDVNSLNLYEDSFEECDEFSLRKKF